MSFPHTGPHRTIWKLTGIVVLTALIVLANRWGSETFHQAQANRLAGEKRESEIRLMLALLSRDPRVRRRSTRRQVERVSKFAEDRPESPAEGYYARGLLRYYGRGDLVGAEKAFRQAIAQDPGWSWSHNGLAIVLFDSGREAEAGEAWRTATTLDPAWSRPYSDQAIFYRRAGRMDEASAAIHRALELDPAGATTRYNHAVLLDVQGRHDRARQIYLDVIALDPGLPAPHYNLACSYAREGLVEAALAPLAQALRLNEDFRREARRDKDFDLIRDTPEFQRLVH